MAPRHAQTGTAGLGLRLGLALALALAFAFGSRLRLRLRVGVRVGSWLCRARLLRLLRARLAAPGGSRHLGPKAGPLGAQPLPWARELAASKAANTTAFDHSGGGQGPGGAPYQGGDRGLQSTHTPAARAVSCHAAALWRATARLRRRPSARLRRRPSALRLWRATAGLKPLPQSPTLIATPNPHPNPNPNPTLTLALTLQQAGHLQHTVAALRPMVMPARLPGMAGRATGRA
jgi:hypothetical protein